MALQGKKRERASGPEGPILFLAENVRAEARTLRIFGHSARAEARTLPYGGLRSCLLFAFLSTFLAATASGCRSYHVDTTIENRTGEPIQLLEVDYPSASYGADSLAAGADFHYRIQVEGKGQLKVLYTTNEGKPVQITGPTLMERQAGRLEVVLLPNGKAEFHPELSAAR